jgi:ABC-2 type transport system permease protein
MQALLVRHSPIVPVATLVQPPVFLLILSARQATLPGRTATQDVLSVILTSLWGATLWTSGGILRREIAEGTLARGLTSRTDPRLVIIGKCLGATIVTLGLLLVSGTVMGVALRARLALGGLGTTVLGLAVVALSGAALGFMVSGVFVVTRYAHYVTAALTYPVYILAGLMIPTSALPVVLRPISNLISLYWANRFLRAAVTDHFDGEALGMVVLLTAAYFVVGGLYYITLIDRARRKGTLDLV